MIKAFLLGLLASLFFAVTFILNRQMGVSGGHWIWTSSLRFFYMLPMLFAILILGKRYATVVAEIRKAPGPWLLWSTVGFGAFYFFICLASGFGPSWLLASTWQVTIVAGALLSPLFYEKADSVAGGPRRRHGLPGRQLAISLVILGGVMLVQAREASIGSPSDALAGAACVLVAAFAYPLGNRKMMELVDKRLDTVERVFGMTLCSMPFWIVLAVIGLAIGERPTTEQYVQTFVVALFSGVIATILFFKATEMAHGNAGHLAVVESTQAGEVVFALAGGVIVYGDRSPDPLGYLGLAVVVLGLLLNGMPPKRTAA